MVMLPTSLHREQSSAGKNDFDGRDSGLSQVPRRYNEMSLCSISLYRAAGQAHCYASVAKRHIAYQQVFKIPSASASTRPHGLRKPAARSLKSHA